MQAPSRHYMINVSVACAAAFYAHQAMAFEMLSRSDWRAQEPSGAMERHTPIRITIHHTATLRRPDTPLAQKLRSLQTFSQSAALLADGTKKAAWADIPYHFYIDASGKVAEGRPVEFIGDTNTNYDPRGHIGIAVEGNFETEEPSAAQLGSLIELLTFLLGEFNLTSSAIDHHGSFAATACPGRNLEARLPDVIKHASQTKTMSPDDEVLDRVVTPFRPRKRLDGHSGE